MLEPTMMSIIAKAENDEIKKRAERMRVYKSQQVRNRSDGNKKLAVGLTLSGAITSLLVWLIVAY
jgi:hypothetical protein